MEQKSFSSLVNQYFGFLINEYGYSMTERMHNNQPFSDGIIQLHSNNIIITIIFNREDLNILIGPVSEPEIARLSVETIVEYLTGGKVGSIIPSEWYSRSTASMIEKRLSLYREALKQYCDPLLRGDISWWIDLYKYFVKKLQDEYRSQTGEELPEKSFDEYIMSKEQDDTAK